MSSKPSWRNVKQNLKWGSGWGLLAGVAVTIWVVGLDLVSAGEALSPYGLSKLEAASLAMAVALAGGGIVGILRPLTTSAIGSAAVGFLIALAVYSFAFMSPGTALTGWRLVIVLLLAIVTGPLGGVIFYSATSSQRGED